MAKDYLVSFINIPSVWPFPTTIKYRNLRQAEQGYLPPAICITSSFVKVKILARSKIFRSRKNLDGFFGRELLCRTDKICVGQEYCDS